MHPFLAKTIYFGIQFLRQEPIQTALLDVKRTEFLPLVDLKNLQASRMIEQLQFAISNVPYYQTHYKSFVKQINSLTSWDDVNTLMNELPRVSKEDVQKDSALFTAININKISTHPDKTSGSTGTPLVFPSDQRSWAYRHALAFRNMQMHNIQIGDPHVIFYGLHWNKYTRYLVTLRDFIFNRVRVSAFDISRKTFESYLIKIRQHHPIYFHGYPSAIYDFCHLAYEFGIDLRELKLRAVFTTAEPLLPFQREMIHEMTGSRCVNQYGSAEGGFTAFECPEGNLHIAIEAVWLRLEDPLTFSGNALLTDMMLRAFPMINYAIGDEITLKEEVCDCGRHHPLLKSINGRSGEPILLPNGRRIDSHLPGYIFKPLATLRVIQRYRFVLQGNNIKLFLIVSEKFSDEHMKLIERETKAAFGTDVNFTTHIVSQMEDLPNSKHKSFVVKADKQSQ